jgi:hypothetical protein
MADLTAPALPAGARNWRVTGRAALARCAYVCGAAWRQGRAWRLHAAAPGFAGAALLSVGAGGLAGHIWPGTGVWVTLAAAGMFCLRFDSRMG